ncbi:MAG: glycoside hydrolase family 32 protein [Akkermansiaceae bacterium]|nr:glycoside hydrolase family 32 protein [Akkermansiaceae bacterium]
MKVRVMKPISTFLIPTLLVSALSAVAADDRLIADFEGADYSGWSATGDAFGNGPAGGTLPGQMAVGDYQGKGLVNSFRGGDGSTGTLTSPSFTIDRPFLRFLIGGGGWEGKTCMELLVDGKSVRSATGPNTEPGGSENLAPAEWDVREFQGKEAVLRITDKATGGWGHINIDHIVLTETRLPGMRMNVERSFVVSEPFLLIPIRNGADKREVTFLLDGKEIVTNTIELADAEPDWWAFVDTTAWMGKSLTLRVDKLREDSAALDQVTQSDSLRGSEALYQEKLRGRFHFSSRRGWLNDPNGLVFHNGLYHLFYQHNPYGWSWGNMHWGHAVSPDMIHWRELPSALAPDSFGPMFSGGAVVDWNNTSGFGETGKPPVVLFYTAAGDPTVQCLAHGTDGVHFTKYEGNPILDQVTPGNRDPKVVWHEPSGKWVMTLYVEHEGVHTIHFYNSSDLKQWTYLSRVDGLFECPEFYQLGVDGDPSDKKWVLSGASGEYFVGSFDSRVFQPETPKLRGPHGDVYYAAQNFSNIPESDGRCIQIGWLRTETRGMPFNQSMSIPRELKLVRTPDGPRQTMTPVEELAGIRIRSQGIAPRDLEPGGRNPLDGFQAELVEIRAEIEPGDAEELTIDIRGAKLIYRKSPGELEINGVKAPAPLRDGRLDLIVYCDLHVIEIFACGGLVYLPISFQPDPRNLSTVLSCQGGAARIRSLHAYTLSSAWRAR